MAELRTPTEPRRPPARRPLARRAELDSSARDAATGARSSLDRPALRAIPQPRPSRFPTSTCVGVLLATLCLIGLVMVGSASPIISMSLYGSSWGILIRQVMWMGLGVVAFYVLSRVDYRKWRKVRVPLLIVTLGLLVVVLVPGIGVTAGGSSRWVGFGQFRLQPSEIMKLALAVFAADLLTRRVGQVRQAKRVVVPILGVLGISSVLILKQPDMGTALVLACIAFGVMFMGGVPMRPILKVLGTFAVLATIVGLADPYRRDRILSFINPGAHQSGTGYQVWQSLIGLGSGHLTGLGLGGGRQKWGLLPNAHTDFIFSVLGEELGLVGAVVVLALFFALAWYGLRAASLAPDRFGSLLAVAITVWITSQAVINVGAVVGVLPVTGIPLPFISFGGSSLVINMAAVGILMNIAVQERSPSAGGAPVD